MSFVSPWANLHLMLVSDKHKLPWILTEKLIYDSPLTGEEYEIPRHFRTNLVSMPKIVAALPGIGGYFVYKYLKQGIWLGAREAVLHDWLRTRDRWGNLPVPAKIAHKIFREALYQADYEPEMIETYYQAVVLFNT